MGMRKLSIKSCQPVLILSLFVCLVGGCWWDNAPNVTAEPTALPTVTPALPTPNITLFNITINDSYYGDQNNNAIHPPRWEAPSGGAVILNIENRGNLEHNWAIIKQGVTPEVPYDGGQDSQIILYGAGMVYSNNKTTVTFLAPNVPGEYLVMCTVPNHYPLMQGRLLIK
jgi:hypothetical protein